MHQHQREVGHKPHNMNPTWHGPSEVKRQKLSEQCMPPSILSNSNMPAVVDTNNVWQAQGASNSMSNHFMNQPYSRSSENDFLRPTDLYAPESAKCQQASTTNMYGQANVRILPEIPAEQTINRIASELDTLGKTIDMFKQVHGNDVKAMTQDQTKMFQSYKTAQGVLRKQMKRERQKQHSYNLQLSFQMQQRMLSTAEDLGGLSPAEKKLKQDETAYAKSFEEYAQVQCELSELECRIDHLTSESDDRILAESEFLELQELTRRKSLLEGNLKHLKKACRSLSQQILANKHGINPFSVMQRLAIRIRDRRQSKLKELSYAQRMPQRMHVPVHEARDCDIEIIETSGTRSVDVNQLPVNEQNDQNVPMEVEMKDISILSPDEKLEDVHMWEGDKTRPVTPGMKLLQNEVIEVSDVELEDNAGVGCGNTVVTHGHNKHPFMRTQKVKTIDKCNAENVDAQESYFLLSGLASILLERQRQNKLKQSQHTMSDPGAVSACSSERQPAHCRLIGEIATKLNLTVHQVMAQQLAKARSLQQRRNRRKQSMQTVNMYLAVHSQQQQHWI